MNKVDEINKFLKLMAGAAKNGYVVDATDVYNNMKYLGVKNRKNISGEFDGWINYFKDTENISVFVDLRYEYFCQFVNRGSNSTGAYNKIKLYIPLDEEHIVDGAKKIFDFLAKENIVHVSKIGSHIRFDDIVIRVDTQEDADKVINFVNNDSYIKSGLLPSSPFAITANGVALAWDGNLSYNKVTASWISDYINWERENNNLDNVGYSRFYAFIQKKNYSLFTLGEQLDKHAYKLEGERVIYNIDSDAEINISLGNYYDVTKLLIMSLDPNSKKRELYDYYRMVSNKDYQKENVSYIQRLRDGGKKQENSFFSQQVAVFGLSFQRMVEKYGYDVTKKHFIEFINTGNYDYITRSDGARKMLIDNMITKEVASLIVFQWKKENLDNAIVSTYNKYGYAQVYGALQYAISRGDFSRFTNDNNFRNELIASFTDGDLKSFVKEILINEGYDMSNENYDYYKEYIDKIIQNSRKNRKSL